MLLHEFHCDFRVDGFGILHGFGIFIWILHGFCMDFTWIYMVLHGIHSWIFTPPHVVALTTTPFIIVVVAWRDVML